jgi:hypothetical protein
VISVSYGPGINCVDARAAVQRPRQPRTATTDFYQAGAASNRGRFGVSANAFLIDHSHEQVYVPDDGSFDFNGPSRAYGYEAKSRGGTDAPYRAERRIHEGRERFKLRRRSSRLRR